MSMSVSGAQAAPQLTDFERANKGINQAVTDANGGKIKASAGVMFAFYDENIDDLVIVSGQLRKTDPNKPEKHGVNNTYSGSFSGGIEQEDLGKDSVLTAAIIREIVGKNNDGELKGAVLEKTLAEMLNGRHVALLPNREFGQPGKFSAAVILIVDQRAREILANFNTIEDDGEQEIQNLRAISWSKYRAVVTDKGNKEILINDKDKSKEAYALRNLVIDGHAHADYFLRTLMNGADIIDGVKERVSAEHKAKAAAQPKGPSEEKIEEVASELEAATV